MNRFVQKVNEGDSIDERFTATVFNIFADAANARFGQRNQRGIPLDLNENPNIIDIRNDSGAERSRYDILALNGTTWTPTDNLLSFRNGPIFKGTLPTLADSGRFAILLDPLGTADGNKYGIAAIGGAWVAKLNIVHEQHPYADIANNSARLTSNWYGAAKILAKESGTGEKWAYVKLIEQFRGPIEGKVSAPSGIAAGATGSVTVWVGGAESSPAHSIQGEFKWMATGTLPFNAQCLAWWVPDQQKYKIYNSSCPVIS